MIDERRRYRRLKEGVKMVFRILDKSEKEEYKALNFGTGGICLLLREKLEPGMFLELELALPDKKDFFNTSAKVIWCADIPKNDEAGNSYYETGIKFLKMNLSDRKDLIRYIRGQSNRETF